MTKRSPPRAARRPVTLQAHGYERVDDYAWLRVENWREVMQDPTLLDAEVRAHLEAENAYAEAALSDRQPLIDALFEEMKARIKEDDESVPAPDGPYAYYSRHRKGGQYPIFARKNWDAKARVAYGEETVLLDGDAAAEGHDYLSIGGLEHSPDHTLIAYAVDTAGSEFYDIRFLDIATGEELPDRLAQSAGDFVWANDSRTLFWVKRDENSRPAMVFRHRLGEDPANDELIYEEKDPGFFVSVGKSDSERFVIINTHNHSTTELYVLEADAPDGAFRLIEPRTPDIEYDIADHGDTFYVLTNADGAVDFKLMTAPIDAPQRSNWKAWIPEREGVFVLGQETYANHHVRMERVQGLPRVIVRRLSDGEEHVIAMDEEAYALGFGGSLEYDTHVVRLAYASPTTPDQVYDYDMETRERRLLKTRQVPSGHDPANYVARRIFASAPDGASVPITIVHHVRTPIDGAAPAVLYGYGSYGITIPADFRTSRLSLIDRGFVYAIAHVRGGSEKGYRWYLDGKLDQKINTFADYLAAADALVAEGFAAKGKLVAIGGSAGGLLVGAALNMRPEAFAGAVAAVPFVDVLTTMSDADLPLTPPEWPEWGNPIESAEAYQTIAGYSPYDNVAARAYPPVLATAGLTDPRVTYWEPAKWVAKLRDCSTSGNPTLLKINMDAGHGGASGRWDSLKETAFEFAFALDVADLADRAPYPRASTEPADT